MKIKNQPTLKFSDLNLNEECDVCERTNFIYFDF